MPIDKLAYVGVYDSVADAEADYQLTKDLHRDAGLIDAYGAAVVERREAGKTKIVKETRDPDARRRCAWAAESGSLPVWSWRCSRSQPSVEDCSRARPPAAPCSARSPGMRRRG